MVEKLIWAWLNYLSTHSFLLLLLLLWFALESRLEADKSITNVCMYAARALSGIEWYFK